MLHWPQIFGRLTCRYPGIDSFWKGGIQLSGNIGECDGIETKVEKEFG